MLQAATRLSRTSAPAAASHALSGSIATRFGEVALDSERVIVLPSGLFGFAHRTHYILCELPGRPGAFKLLQAVDEPELGFLVLPLDPANGPIAAADLEAACRDLRFAPASTAVLVIVTLRREGDRVCCTLNLKAPVFIETSRQVGCQHVLASDAYNLRHPLPLG